jgi:hypothetical protein
MTHKHLRHIIREMQEAVEGVTGQKHGMRFAEVTRVKFFGAPFGREIGVKG